MSEFFHRTINVKCPIEKSDFTILYTGTTMPDGYWFAVLIYGVRYNKELKIVNLLFRDAADARELISEYI